MIPLINCKQGTCCEVTSNRFHLSGCERREGYLVELSQRTDTPCLCPEPGKPYLPFMDDCPKHRTGKYGREGFHDA